MPLDILYEIFTKMHPADLLHTARTTKMLRSMLLSASLAWIWMESYAAQDLPPVPDDMNMLQFLSFLYDKTCYYCSALGAGTVIWTARIRCCKKCLLNTNLFVPYRQLYHVYGLTVLEHCVSRVTIKVDRKDEERLFSVDSVRTIQGEYERVSKRGNRKAINAWMSKMEEHFSKIRAHSEICEQWDLRRQLGRNEELQQVRELRKAEIVRRLTHLGWGEEIEKLDAQVFAKQKHVNKAQLLTDKVWLNIKEPLLGYMEKVKEARLAEEKRAALSARYRLLTEAYHKFRLTKPHRCLFPGIGDVATTPQIVRMIEDTPYDQELPEAALSAVLHDLPQSYFDEWRERCDNALIQLLDSTRECERTTRADLDLATTVFGLEKGRGAELPYPFVLVSPDVTRVKPGKGDSSDPSTFCGHRPWSAERLIVSTSQIARQLVKLAGLDPETATHVDMDALDPWYVCATDEAQCIMVRAMNWRCARRQSMHRLRFELLQPDKAEALRAVLSERLHQGLGGDVKCAHCDQRFWQAPDLYGHIDEVHDILPPHVRRKDYVLSLELDDSLGSFIYVADVKDAQVSDITQKFKIVETLDGTWSVNSD
ncbi:hypothetical protein BD626DRAFT_627522 [Schizophyllum amplum]|uniref:F-box domain-containing protein n=1 Tax=Schizophyllum amplum TaxID=97359 RepID=A0A550CQM1_9AGAR|nr:hypothetical protein BD626DRAFT_627522 [Auriculariopsis ampla]